MREAHIAHHSSRLAAKQWQGEPYLGCWGITLDSDATTAAAPCTAATRHTVSMNSRMYLMVLLFFWRLMMTLKISVR